MNKCRLANQKNSHHYLNYYRLGATLYSPATLDKLTQHLNANTYHSLVVCTEDAIHEHEVEFALNNIQKTLYQLQPSATLRFIRPRNVQILRTLLTMPGIDKIDGFVLPKVDLSNISHYRQLFSDHAIFTVMPTLETEIAFDQQALRKLCSELNQFPCQILCLRIGGNDLLNILKIKRPRNLSIYETPIRQAIDNCITVFKPHHYQLSAPVYEYIDNASEAILKKELEMDIAHGLLAKTAIHPCQVEHIQTAYKVTRSDYEIAKKILNPEISAVFKFQGQMCEPATHHNWAEETMLRSSYYGLCF